jgi:chromate transporter
MHYQPTLRELFLAFLQIGVSSFGGALPWARRILLEERKWLDDKAFTEMLTISQTLPGPNIVNLASYYGTRHRGALGAAAACLGLLVVPMAIVLTLSMIYLKFAHISQVKGAILGMTAAATAFMYSQAVKLSKPFSHNAIAVALAVATFLIGIVLRWPMPLVLLACGAVSIGLAFKGRV